MEAVRIIMEIVILIGLGYIAFFKSYFTEKGKNLASKEDLKELTEKVESVKIEFNKELEKFKLSLVIDLEKKRPFIEDEAKSIIELIKVAGKTKELVTSYRNIDVKVREYDPLFNKLINMTGEFSYNKVLNKTIRDLSHYCSILIMQEKGEDFEIDIDFLKEKIIEFYDIIIEECGILKNT